MLASLLRPLSSSGFEKTVKGHPVNQRVRTLSTGDLFRMLVYGPVSGCFSVRELANSLVVNRSNLYHAGLPPLKRSTRAAYRKAKGAVNLQLSLDGDNLMP